MNLDHLKLFVKTFVLGFLCLLGVALLYWLLFASVWSWLP